MRIIIFSPHFRIGINPRSIRLENMLTEIGLEYEIIIPAYSSSPIKVLADGMENEKPSKVSKKLIVHSNTAWKKFIKSLFWPDVYLFHSLYYLFYYAVWLRKRGDVIYTVSNPFSMHLAGLVCKKLIHNTWIADIGDPLYLKTRNNLSNRIKTLLEKLILNNCDEVVLNSESLKEYYVAKFNIIENKFTIISNGIRIRQDKIVKQSHSGIVLSFVGNTYSNVREGIDEMNILFKLLSLEPMLKIQFIGVIYKELLKLIQANNFKDRITVYKAESVEELEEAYNNSDFLLNFANKNHIGTPSKWEEYNLVGLPLISFYYNEPILENYFNNQIFHFKIGKSTIEELREFIRNYKNVEIKTKRDQSNCNRKTWHDFFKSVK